MRQYFWTHHTVIITLIFQSVQLVGVYSAGILNLVDATAQHIDLDGYDHEAGKFPIIVRRLEAKKPVYQFMFEAQINVDGLRTSSAWVAFDSRLNKLRADFSREGQKQNTLQLIDLDKEIVFHKLPALDDGSKSMHDACAASYIRPKQFLSIGQLLLGADLVEDLGWASEGDHVRKYRAIQSSLPFWLDQDLEPPAKEDAKPKQATEMRTSFFYFNTIDKVVDKLARIEVETVKIVDGRPVQSNKLDITISNFHWSLHDAPEDVSKLFSLARECPQVSERVHKVRVEAIGKNQLSEFADVAKRNLLILRTIQSSLKLPSELISHLRVESVEDKDELKLTIDFNINPWTKWIGSFRGSIGSDSKIESKERYAVTIPNSISFSQCYYYAATRDGLDSSGLIDQTFFKYESKNKVCRLASEPSSITSTLDAVSMDLVWTMRKLPLQVGFNLEKWLKRGIGTWLALNGLEGTASFRMTQFNLDGIDVKIRDAKVKPDIPDNNNTNPNGGPTIEALYSIGTVLTLALFSVAFLLAVLLIAFLRHKISVRKASAVSDLDEIVVRYSNDEIEMDGNRKVLEIA